MKSTKTRGSYQGAALMKCTTKYAGLDVHQATTSITVRGETGQVITRSVVATEAAPLVEYFRGMRGAVHVALEEGTQAQWLHDLLEPQVHQVVVCDQRRRRQKGNKADKLDADRLSDLLRRGALRAVYHGGGRRSTLKELSRTYQNVVEDGTRTMLRLKALFRARSIRAPGRDVYGAEQRSEWLARLEGGVRFRAEVLYSELDVLRALRPKVQAALIGEAQRDPAFRLLRGIPFIGPVRAALLLATMQTPWRFRTKRNLWAYAGLAVVTSSSSDYVMVGGRPVRRRRPPLTRGLNRNHNRMLKNVFKSAATAATSRPGPLQDIYRALVARGLRAELARVTLARKLAAVTLHVWKKGERYDPARLTRQTR
jgi:transposase